MKCFLVAKNGDVRLWLRRYASGDCPGPGRSYHNAQVLIGDFSADVAFEKYVTEIGQRESLRLRPEFEAQWPKADARWPIKCDHCDHAFIEADAKQLFDRWVFVDEHTAKYVHDDFPPGAMWWEDWLPSTMYWDNQQGPHLHAMTPGGVWNIDSRASNCSRSDDRTHRCWIRHGEPPNIHVDKNGDTCAAGTGSILAGSYHGFLHNGELISC